MSVSSSTDIANLACDLLSAGTVNNIEIPTNATESLFNRWYDQSRRKVLREHPWNFASKRIILAASSTTPEFGYTYQFPVPSDFIRLNTIHDSEGNSIDRKSYSFEGRAILINSDTNTLKVKYVYDITNVNAFDPLFVDILSLDLAISVAYKLTNNNTNIQRIAELSKLRSSIARAIDGQESPPERREVSKNITARRVGSTRNSNRIVFS